MAETVAITVKLTSTEMLLLSELLASRKYDSRSAALRAGLGKLFPKKLKPEIEYQLERERRISRPRRSKKGGN